MARNKGEVKRHQVVSHDAWMTARSSFLATEKEFTRARDQLSRQRRELPWEKVEKQYAFEGVNGPESLAALFEDSSQLIVYHFMFEPSWEEGCKSCSFLADHLDDALVHLAARDTSFAVISRAPPAKLETFKKRMG